MASRKSRAIGEFSSPVVVSWIVGVVLMVTSLITYGGAAQPTGHLIPFLAAFTGLGAILRSLAANGRWALAGTIALSLVVACFALQHAYGEWPVAGAIVHPAKCHCGNPLGDLGMAGVLLLAFVHFEKCRTSDGHGTRDWLAWVFMRLFGLLVLVTAIDEARIALHHFRGLLQDLDYCQSAACGTTKLVQSMLLSTLAGMWYFCPGCPRPASKIAS